MLSEEIIEKLTERLTQRITKVNLFILKKIARKIKEIGTLMPSNAKQIIQIMDYGGDLKEITRALAKATKLNIKDIYDIFDAVAKSDQNFAKKYYEYKKKKFIPWEDNEFLRKEVEAIAKQTANNYLNISRTRGVGYTVKKLNKEGKLETVFMNVSDVYKETVDEAILSVSQGKTSFEEEMYKVMKDLASSGLKYVDYEGGYHRRLDSAIRMNMMDGLRQLHNKTQEIFGKEFDSDGVEISVHNNPAPDHAEVQGRQFSNEEFEKFQNDMDCVDVNGRPFPAEVNGRDRRSISEYNCYHQIFVIVLGVSKPQYTDEQLQAIIDKNEEGFDYEGKHYTMYEGTQLQRKLESEIRSVKDMQIMGVESGNEELINKSQKRINQLTNKYYELSKASGLSTKIERLRVDGYKEVEDAE